MECLKSLSLLGLNREFAVYITDVYMQVLYILRSMLYIVCCISYVVYRMLYIICCISYVVYHILHIVLQVGSKYGMAYDAVHLYAFAFRKLIDLNKTITGPQLASAVRQVTFKPGRC